MGFEPILALIVLALDIWAIVQILKGANSNGTKVFWVLIIICLPVLGLIAWLVAGRRTAAAL
ncbi:MAG TPA: PLD nuclease N-terminal domain-containing protein [Rhizomicrobium sp.]